jgi:hypothetical protein
VSLLIICPWLPTFPASFLACFLSSFVATIQIPYNPLPVTPQKQLCFAVLSQEELTGNRFMFFGLQLQKSCKSCRCCIDEREDLVVVGYIHRILF